MLAPSKSKKKNPFAPKVESKAEDKAQNNNQSTDEEGKEKTGM